MCMYVSRASLRWQETDFVKIAYVKYQCNIINNHILLLIFIRLLLEGGKEREGEGVLFNFVSKVVFCVHFVDSFITIFNDKCVPWVAVFYRSNKRQPNTISFNLIRDPQEHCFSYNQWKIIRKTIQIWLEFYSTIHIFYFWNKEFDAFSNFIKLYSIVAPFSSIFFIYLYLR